MPRTSIRSSRPTAPCNPSSQPFPRLRSHPLCNGFRAPATNLRNPLVTERHERSDYLRICTLGYWLDLSCFFLIFFACALIWFGARIHIPLCEMAKFMVGGKDRVRGTEVKLRFSLVSICNTSWTLSSRMSGLRLRYGHVSDFDLVMYDMKNRDCNVY